MEEKLTPGRKLILDLLAKSVAKIKAADSENKVKENDLKIVSRKKIKTEKDMKEIIVEDHYDVKVETGNKIKEEYVEHKFIQEEKEDKREKKLSKPVAKIKLADGENEIKENDVKIVRRKKIKTEKDTKENIDENQCDYKVENGNKIKEEYVEHKLITEEKEGKKKKMLNKDKDDEKVCINPQDYLDDAKGLINIKSEHISKVPDMKNKLDKQKLKKPDSKAKVLIQKVQSNNLPEVDKDNRDKSPKHRFIKRKAGTSSKIFSCEEDQIILNAIEMFGDKINFAQLGKDLQRTWSSLKHAVRRLKAGKKKTNKKTKFTLSEDLMILDVVLKNLGEESLETLNLNINEWREFGAQIGREEKSTRMRWNKYLKVWILQHFAGTLNLDLRRPLANYLAENFSDINSVDWHSVIKKPEFAGHTTNSLRAYFSNIFKHAKGCLQRDGEDVSLVMIAEFANTKYAAGARKVLDKDLKRQQEIIDYFKCYVKTNCITNFL